MSYQVKFEALTPIGSTEGASVYEYVDPQLGVQRVKLAFGLESLLTEGAHLEWWLVESYGADQYGEGRLTSSLVPSPAGTTAVRAYRNVGARTGSRIPTWELRLLGSINWRELAPADRAVLRRIAAAHRQPGESISAAYRRMTQEFRVERYKGLVVGFKEPKRPSYLTELHTLLGTRRLEGFFNYREYAAWMEESLHAARK